MKEIEAKILEVDENKIAENLSRLGAKKLFDGEIKTLLFDFKDGAIIKARNLLRLRKENGKIELTYKKVQVTQEVKIADEYSVQVSDLENIKRILEFLGLSVIESMCKHRISYTLSNAHFDIDRYEGHYSYIPSFIEIEGQTADSIHRYAELLGFRKEDCLPWSTQDLINHYSSKRPIEK